MESQQWTNWPDYDGQQFIHHKGETWVGNVETIPRDDDVKMIVWKGGSHFVIWESQYSGKFWFRQIDWPQPPTS